MSAQTPESPGARLGWRTGPVMQVNGVRVLARVLWVVALGAFAIHALHVTVGVGGSSTDGLDVWFYFGSQFACGLLLIVRGLADRRERLAWTLIGLGVCAYGTGGPVYSLVVLHQGTYSFPSAADLLWLALYPLAYAGVLLVCRPERPDRCRPGRVWL